MHHEGCWINATVKWAYDQGSGDQRSTTGPEDPLTAWWLEVARAEAAAVVPKAIEYGATDLVEIGRTLLQATGEGQNLESWPLGMQAELGVFFYVVGKMARWTDAVKTGRSVSDDTLHDIGVYIRMAQRIRAAGSWPGVKLEGGEK